jgi:uncharacterized protein
MSAGAATQGATLITGASSGIGEELAYAFAAEGKPMILVALPSDHNRLTAVADKCRQLGASSAIPICMDLSDRAAISQLTLTAADNGLHIEQLVNNAGYGIMSSFADAPDAPQLGMIDVNVVALTKLTRQFLPDMIARGRGGVLNTASTGGLVPGPGMAVYFATKAYVLSLTDALEHELRGTGVSITALCPGPTVTGFLERSGMTGSAMFQSMKAMDSKTVAALGYRAFKKRKPRVIAGWSNRLAMFGLSIMPRRMSLNTIWKLHQRAR